MMMGRGVLLVMAIWFRLALKLIRSVKNSMICFWHPTLLLCVRLNTAKTNTHKQTDQKAYKKAD